MLVMKFGGTSVGSAVRFAEVAHIIKREYEREQQLVAVVSAMSGTTSALIEGARAAAGGQEERYQAIRDGLLSRHLQAAGELLADTSEYPPVEEYIRQRLHDYDRLCQSIATLGEFTMRGNDAVASIGEELSSRILAALLRVQGQRAVAVSATTLVRTDAQYGSAVPDMDASRGLVCERLRPMLEQGVITIVTGFIGATAQGVTTTLGRGGSDYSAAILGACLDADEVWIWTDVNGILTADPKLVPEARTLPELSYREAEELAFFGADVLHPKTVIPLAERGIPLRILNSYNAQHPGTLIVPQPDGRRPAMPAIISTEGLCLIGVVGNPYSWSLQMAQRALKSLAEAGVDVLMFSQSFTERNLNLVVRGHDQEHSVHLLRREFERDLRVGLLSDIGVQEQVATISVVGMPNGDKSTARAASSIASQAFAALGKLGVRVISVGQPASAYSVSFVIPESEVARAVPFIHHELGLGATSSAA
jgi:aspartokinase/homoserine dehydrogenase 1